MTNYYSIYVLKKNDGYNPNQCRTIHTTHYLDWVYHRAYVKNLVSFISSCQNFLKVFKINLIHHFNLKNKSFAREDYPTNDTNFHSNDVTWIHCVTVEFMIFVHSDS
jgi:hypothetical protein